MGRNKVIVDSNELPRLVLGTRLRTLELANSTPQPRLDPGLILVDSDLEEAPASEPRPSRKSDES